MQATLEQIFNQFAAQQDEETGAVAGMVGPAAAAAAAPPEMAAAHEDPCGQHRVGGGLGKE